MPPTHRPTDSVDVVYLFCHSRFRDQKLVYSLRSVARHLPFVRKVWIFGDRPEFLSDDKSVVEHVFHGYIAPLLGCHVPVRNDFLMLFLASLIPGLAFDFVRFCDDYILLQALSRAQLCRLRAVEDLNRETVRLGGQFPDMLWRTYDILKRSGYAGYNFESHVPQALNRQVVFEAFMAFRSFLSEDRFGGMLAETAICNYALKYHGLNFTWLPEEHSKVGFYLRCPSESEIGAACQGKLFINFDDDAFGPPMREFLEKKFPEPCKYERR